MQQDLDLPSDMLRLVRVEKDDARSRSDDFLSLRDFVMQSEEAYPNIGSWFDSKVSEGVRSGERTGFLALINERPVAAAVVKRGVVTKFCHLKISASARSRSIGDLLFILMALDVRHHAKKVHFTLPESLWEDRKKFFNAYTFNRAEKAGKQYRLFDSELHSQTSFTELFRASTEKLPQLFGHLAIGQHSLLTGAVLAVQPDPLAGILSGTKTVEIRTRFSKRWEGRRVSLYATHPISGLAGEATIVRVIEGTPDRIWEHFGHQMGASRTAFEAYTRNRDHVFALILTDVRAFRDPIPLSQLTHLLGMKLSAPQSYLSLEDNQGWLAAVMLAAALQGSIRLFSQPAKRTLLPAIQEGAIA
jgi:predicted transcriptional regulator